MVKYLHWRHHILDSLGETPGMCSSVIHVDLNIKGTFRITVILIGMVIRLSTKSIDPHYTQKLKRILIGSPPDRPLSTGTRTVCHPLPRRN